MTGFSLPTRSATAWRLVLGFSFACSATGAFAHNGEHHEAPAPAASTTIAHEQPFLDLNAEAMTRMMSGMAVQPTGNIDEDFVNMMSPHHQGAIDMCTAYLPYSTNAQLKRVCQEIIVTQQQEIAAMYLAIGKPLPPSVAAPTQ